jgi:RNA polymerase sigma-70 factor (ECF subfamily)
MPSRALDEAEVARLVAAAALGDGLAVERLYHLYRPYLAVLAGPNIPRELRSRFDTDDVLQSAFLEAFRALRNYEYTDERHFRAWLRKITLNKLQDRIKRDVAQRRNAFTELKGVDFEQRADSGSETPSVIMSKAERQADLLAAIQNLPPLERQVLVLRSFERRSFAEIAASVGVSEDAARRRFLNAVEALVLEIE